MTDAALAWTEEQWSRVRQVVHDEALRARVAASFLPLYGPLPGGVETVPANALDYAGNDTPPPETRMEINDYDTLRLMTVAVNVQLKSHMVADPELAAATILFRRAADVVARVEDSIIFTGKKTDRKTGRVAIAGAQGVPPVYTVSGAPDYRGLLDCAPCRLGAPAGDGPGIYQSIVEAVTALEGAGHHRPFAAVLGNGLFNAVNRPIPNSMVLPRDSIPPFIEGPLLRSSNLPPESGLVISLHGDPVEIVVPSDITVRYLQTTLDAKHVFRVSQRFVLRVKEPTAIAAISGA